MLNLLTSPIFDPFNVKEMTYFFMGLYGSNLNHNWGRNRKAQNQIEKYKKIQSIQ